MPVGDAKDAISLAISAAAIDASANPRGFTYQPNRASLHRGTAGGRREAGAVIGGNAFNEFGRMFRCL